MFKLVVKEDQDGTSESQMTFTSEMCGYTSDTRGVTSFLLTLHAGLKVSYC